MKRKILYAFLICALICAVFPFQIETAHANGKTDLITDPEITSYDYWTRYHMVAKQYYVYDETYFSCYDNGGHYESISEIDDEGWYWWMYNGYKNSLGFDEHGNNALLQGQSPHTDTVHGTWTDFWIPYPCPLGHFILNYTAENLMQEPVWSGVAHNPLIAPVPFSSFGVNVFFDFEPDVQTVDGYTWWRYDEEDIGGRPDFLPSDHHCVHFYESYDPSLNWIQSMMYYGLWNPFFGVGYQDNDWRLSYVIDTLDYGTTQTYIIDMGEWFNEAVELHHYHLYSEAPSPPIGIPQLPEYVAGRPDTALERYGGQFAGDYFNYLPSGAWVKGVAIASETCNCEYKGRIKHCQLTWYDDGIPAYPVEFKCTGTPYANLWIDNKWVGFMPTTVKLSKGHHILECDEKFLWQRDLFKFVRWDYDDSYAAGLSLYPETLNNLTVIANYTWYRSILAGGSGASHERAGGGWEGGKVCMWSPTTIPDYSFYANTTSYQRNYVVLEAKNGTIGKIGLDVFSQEGIIYCNINGITKLDFKLGSLWNLLGYNTLNPLSFKVDDIDLEIGIYNTSRCEVILRDVPAIVSIEKSEPSGNYSLTLHEGEDWDYSHSDLHLYLSLGDPTITIDFETPTSITYSLSVMLIGLTAFGIVILFVKKQVM